MKIEFKGVDKNGIVIISNSIIQKKINNILYIKLCIKGNWISILNETLKIKQL
jgi:hypothetical protein